jgi:DNA-binding LacI/PurR family transcriptional regulator
MSVSIKDIAEKANVSPSTVSRALNDHPRISIGTKAQIQDLAKTMGYVPSDLARSLVAQRSTTIGLAIADFLDPFCVGLISSIEDALVNGKYHVFVSSFYRERERELALLDAFYERRLVGIIVVGSQVGKAHNAQPHRAAMPAVLINCPQYPYSVSVDQIIAARKAMEHLIELGHRRIAYAQQDVSSTTGTARQQSYRTALDDYDIQVDERLIVRTEGGIGGGIKAAAQLFELSQPPTAILCFNDMMAMGVINALQHRGYDVPKDCSVVGFDDLETSSYYYPSLTTVRQPIYQLGQRAVAMLFRLIHGDENVSREVLFPKLVIRESTALV